MYNIKSFNSKFYSDTYLTKNKNSISNSNLISFPVLILGIVIIIAFTGVWILPPVIKNTLKPIVIVLFFIDLLHSNKKLLFDGLSKVLITFSISLFASLLININSNLSVFISIQINIWFVAIICLREYNLDEIKYIFNSVKYSSLILAVIVMISNPIIGTLHSPFIFLLKTKVNKNSVAYLVAMGLYICLNQLISNKKIKIKSVILLFELLILIYSSIYPMSRGGFLCAFVPFFLTIINTFRKEILNVFSIKNFSKIVLLLIITILIIKLLPEQYVNRLLNTDSYSLENSSQRDVLTKQAINMVTGSKFFGKGFGYYQMISGSTYGCHNCFIDLYVSSGLVGMCSFGYIFLYLLLKTKLSMNVMAWLSMALISAFLESQLSYQIFIPFCMAWLSYKYSLKY